jgi:hypothetical protein
VDTAATDVFDTTNCAAGTMPNDAQSQCVVNTTATDVFDTTNCATGTVYNDTLKKCAVDTTATDVFDETNCATGTVYNDTLKKCVVGTTATDVFDESNCGRGAELDGDKCAPVDKKPCAASSAAPFMFILPETVPGNPELRAKYCGLIKELGGSC